MRVLMNVRLPHEPFNSLVREKKAGEILGRIVEATKPEAIYFLEQNGKRAVVAIVDLAEASGIPALAEPWFLSFNADCEFHPVMSQEDLGKAGLDALGEKWG